MAAFSAFAVACPFMPSALASPGAVSLEEAIRSAIDRHPAIKAAAIGVEVADRNRQAAGAAFLPQLDFSGGYLKTSGGSQGLGFIGANAQNEYRAQVDLVQPLYTGGALTATRDRSEAALEAARHDARTASNQLRWQVVSQYVGVLKAQQALSISRIRLATAEAHMREGQIMLQHGAIASLDAKRNALDLQNARLDVERALGDLSIARSLLSATTGLAVNAEVKPLPTLSVRDGELQALIATAMAQRPEVRNLRARQSAAQADVRIAQAAFQPQVNLVGTGGWDTGQFFALQNGGWSSGLNVTLPVLNWGRLSAQAQAAELTAQRAAQDLAQTELTIRTEVSEAWANRRVAEKQVALADAGVKLAEEAAAMAQQGFKMGGVSNLEFLLTQQALATARRQQADARLGLALMTERLKYTLGEALP